MEVSFGGREVDWVEDPEGVTLGQVNTDDRTRDKITHSEFLGCGIIGSVEGVHYGTWEDKPACLVLMQFLFRSNTGFLRLKRADLTICFHEGADQILRSETPSICLFSPRKIYGDPHPETRKWTADMGITMGFDSGAVSVGPNVSMARESEITKEHRLQIKGKLWGRRKSSVKDKIQWELEEAKKMNYGIPDIFNIGLVVLYNGPFQATVNVRATTAASVPITCPPWSKDDPLLFDTRTTKGKTLPKTKFEELLEEDWRKLVPHDEEWQVSPSLSFPADQSEALRMTQSLTFMLLESPDGVMISIVMSRYTVAHMLAGGYCKASRAHPYGAKEDRVKHRIKHSLS